MLQYHSRNSSFDGGTQAHDTIRLGAADRLRGDMIRVDFSNWMEEPYVFPDGVKGCSGVSWLLEGIRAEDTMLMEEIILECVEKTHEKSHMFNKSDIEPRARCKEVHAYIVWCLI